MFGPVLRGERCLLRPPTAEDAAFRAGYLAELELSRYARMPAQGADPPWLVEKQFAGIAESRDTVWWAIEVGGRGVGGTLITRINWAARHGYHGYFIGDRALWGRGIATEASSLAVRFGFASLNLNKLKAEVVADHLPSRRVLEKVGFRRCATFQDEYYVDGKAADVMWFELLRAEWRG